ncbi:unnamed protein product [Haemonchus placei]|uniref:Secreted protein n=1 Tax=Haemonchus placei TaxID=6290 RepID=A0A0N4W441_HAEPC|nr:unnamed protein product [Haemonchus placei]
MFKAGSSSKKSGGSGPVDVGADESFILFFGGASFCTGDFSIARFALMASCCLSFSQDSLCFFPFT